MTGQATAGYTTQAANAPTLLKTEPLQHVIGQTNETLGEILGRLEQLRNVLEGPVNDKDTGGVAVPGPSAVLELAFSARSRAMNVNELLQRIMGKIQG